MLQELTIKNYALIEDIQISFDQGLNILTGETGAGKSIIIGALSLLLGERVTADVVRKDSSNCEVSGLFSIDGKDSLISYLMENGIVGKDDKEVLFKRLLSREGRSRCYINGQVVTLAILHKVGNYLVDIHGQHTHQLLFNLSEQMNLIDRFGNLLGSRDKVSLMYGEYKKKTAEIESLRALENDKAAKVELYEYQLREINDAKLKPGEEEELESDYNILNNSEKISLIIRDVYGMLYGNEHSAKLNFDKIGKGLDKLAGIDASFEEYSKKLNGIKYELEDIISAVAAYKEKVEYNPKKLEEVIERLELIKKLKRKYGRTINEIIVFGEEAKAELDKLDNSPETLKKLVKAAEVEKLKLIDEAEALSKKRKTAGKKLSSGIEKELEGLAMSNTRFSVKITSSDVKSTGIDNLEFLISPNVGEDMKPLAKIASGGETSRIMLAIKTVLAKADRVPVLIFDEIDAGIGGGVAGVLGRKLKGLCPDHQVICVTHLPQIAGFADTHFQVDKSVDGNRTRTSIGKLEDEQRVEEIARMLGGGKKTPVARKHAREIIEQSAL